MMIYRSLIVLYAAALLTGCVAPQKYAWGNYDQSLYSYYKDTTTSAAYGAELKNIVESAEATHVLVPPGIYAEYGYFLMEQGKASEAVVQFEHEKAKWPESTMLMDNMMKIATRAPKSPESKE